MKKIWMIFLIIGISVVAVLLIKCGRMTDYLKVTHYVYRNNTIKDLSMEVYNRLSGELLRPPYFIASGKKITITFPPSDSGTPPFFYDHNTYKIGDSIVVRFPSVNKYLFYSKGERIFIAKNMTDTKHLLEESIH